MEYPKRSQSTYTKSRFRVQNWAEYEAGFQKRGDLTVWLSDAAFDAWHARAAVLVCERIDDETGLNDAMGLLRGRWPGVRGS